MKELLTAEEMRAREAAAGERGVSTGTLMDRAGTALAEAALELADPRSRFFVFCGPGNNGGDGLVAARVLAGRGRAVNVELVCAAEALKGLARDNHGALLAAGISPQKIPDWAPRTGDVLVDALFGTGLSRAPQGDFAETIRRIARARSLGAKVVAADLPSGVQSDSGATFSPHVEADLTVAFGSLKVAHATEPGLGVCGRVLLADLALLGEPSARTAQLEESDVRTWLPQRAPTSNKGTFGHLLVVAGSPGKSGAAALAALGALRSGVGLVTVASPPEALAQVLAHAPELMGAELGERTGLTPRDAECLCSLLARKQAVVVGPGLARGPETPGFLEAALERLEVPCLLDADGLNALSENLGALKAARAPVVLTPHPGEMSRLSGLKTEEIQANRAEVARTFATAHGVTLVLKGARTVVALKDGRVWINPTGNPGMATGGTGDVLSGVAGAFLAQGLEVTQAAGAAVFVHGLAGDRAAQMRGKMGLIATDLLEGLCSVWRGWNL